MQDWSETLCGISSQNSPSWSGKDSSKSTERPPAPLAEMLILHHDNTTNNINDNNDDNDDDDHNDADDYDDGDDDDDRFLKRFSSMRYYIFNKTESKTPFLKYQKTITENNKHSIFFKRLCCWSFFSRNAVFVFKILCIPSSFFLV